MSFQWPVGKLDLINRALTACGDFTCNVADDGSDEWNVASPTYQDALAYMIEQHGWRFTTVSSLVLQPAANVPADPMYDTAYNLPADLVHLIWVRVADIPASPRQTGYDIAMGPPTGLGAPPRQIYVNAQGGPPPPPAGTVTPSTVTISYVSQSAADPIMATPTFVRALTAFVMSGIYRGLHEDQAEGDKLAAMAEGILAEAKSRHDQEKPKRAFWNSRLFAARSVRRPWPRSPRPWGGTGVPR